MTFVAVVGGQRLDALQHRDPADLAAQIMTAGADRLADARAQPVDEASRPAAGLCRRRRRRRWRRA